MVDQVSLFLAQVPFVGRYTLEVELGRGAVATMYRARDARDGSRVILQVVHPDLAYDVGSERFVREIGDRALLGDPQVLPITEGAGESGVLYYVHPDQPAETLRACLDREGRLSVEVALNLALDIALALNDLHSRGRAHGTIRPDTIQLVAGHALLAGALGGLVRDSGGSLAAEDIKGLGRALVEMLTGNQQPDPDVLSLVPSSVQELLTRLLASAPVPSAEEVAEALNRILAALHQEPGATPRRITATR